MASSSNDNLMQELHQRERHEVTTDQAAGNGSSPTAVMPASIHGENVSVVEQQTNVSGDQKILTGDNYQAQTMNVFVGDKGNNSSPVLSLETIRRQLLEEYRETRGKLPLLPGMPEEFAKMEDIFVDLEIIEEDKKPSGVICKKLNSYGDLLCIERNSTKNQRKELVKRILVRGKPGIGKSTTISKLAYDWAGNIQDSPMSKFDLVFVITVNEIDTDTDLIGIIQEQLLPNVSRQSLEKLFQSHASSVAIFFDGYDEATSHFDRCKDIKNVLCSKWLAGACVMVTTRPNLVGKFCQIYGSYLQVEIIGFSEKAREKYVKKFMRFRKNYNKVEDGDDEDDGNADDDDDEDVVDGNENVMTKSLANDVMELPSDIAQSGSELHNNAGGSGGGGSSGGGSSIGGGGCGGTAAAASDSIIYIQRTKTFVRRLFQKVTKRHSIEALPAGDDECDETNEVRELPISVTALYKDVLMHLAKHRYAKTATGDDLDESNIHDWMDSVLCHIGEIAIIGLFEDRLVFRANEFEKEYLEDACTLGVVIKERKRSGSKVTYSVTFLHKTFQEMCAASYLAKLVVDKDRETLMMYLGRIKNKNIFEMEYFLRFACGWSVQTAEVVLPHVVQVMCKHDKMRYRRDRIRCIDDNECQKLPIFLLYEAERILR
ncbi:uncharacterized protein [Amphiura filiformis]|uniref:uncharacterized protein n=1 Tax=Amphiura filiformis TaxID=82378 RepID=UPI003B221D77